MAVARFDQNTLPGIRPVVRDPRETDANRAKASSLKKARHHSISTNRLSVKKHGSRCLHMDSRTITGVSAEVYTNFIILSSDAASFPRLAILNLPYGISNHLTPPYPDLGRAEICGRGGSVRLWPRGWRGAVLLWCRHQLRRVGVHRLRHHWHQHKHEVRLVIIQERSQCVQMAVSQVSFTQVNSG